MTDVLRDNALGAIAVLRHTSHADKAAALTAYVEVLEAQPNIALERAALLQDKGWLLQRKLSSRTTIWLRHPRPFYNVLLQPNGTAEFRLTRVPDPHVIGAHDADGFEDYIELLDRGEQKALRFAKWFLGNAVAILMATIVLWMGNTAR